MSRPKVLYIAYWGAGEPLGQSLILPAVKRLADLGVELTLVTFEKAADLVCTEEMDRIRGSLDNCGVRWMPLRYHKRSRVPSTMLDIAQGCARAIIARLKTRFDIIHARTFVGGLIGLMLAPVLRAKFVYHNEGFYPDEQVDGEVWKLNSTPHRLAKRLERRMYTRADAIIALSHRAKLEIERISEVDRNQTPVIVVPSCVDLNLFRYKAPDLRHNSTLRLVYSGSVGGRYMLDRIGKFVSTALKEHYAHLQVLTRTSPELVDSILSASGLSEGAWSVESAPYREMPARLAHSEVGMFFLTQGISEHGCSPTKIGEYWSVGLPVITTPNVSDTDEIIRRERVGVIVHEHTDDAYVRAIRELRSLLNDDELSLRCRRAAETHYALEPACARQVSLYNNLTSEDHALSLNECS